MVSRRVTAREKQTQRSPDQAARVVELEAALMGLTRARIRAICVICGLPAVYSLPEVGVEPTRRFRDAGF